MADLVILTAGDCVYVFDEDDDMADLQEMACLGANLDVERTLLTAKTWEVVLPRLGLDPKNIIDCRKEALA